MADQRTHLMGKSRAFLVPVCIDDTRDSDADVPDSFAAVQWTRLPGGNTPPAFTARIAALLGGPGAAIVSKSAPPTPPDACVHRDREACFPRAPRRHRVGQLWSWLVWRSLSFSSVPRC